MSENEKSLGQIAGSAWMSELTDSNVLAWHSLPDTCRAAWEVAAAAVAEHVRATESVIDPEHHTIIDRRLLERMPSAHTCAYAVVCFDGSGFISNGFDPFGNSGALCAFDPGHNTSTAAMQTWLDEHEQPPWGWPVPTDEDEGKQCYVRTVDGNEPWYGPRRLLGVIAGNAPFITRGCNGPTAHPYAVLANPGNPGTKPPVDLGASRHPEPKLDGKVAELVARRMAESWNWPVPTDADRGKAVYYRDLLTGLWHGTLPLLGVVDGEFPYVVPSGRPKAWRYAVVADPNNPDTRPPADLVPGKEGE